MFRYPCCVLILLLSIVSCRKKQSETAQAGIWNREILDSSYSLLYKNKDTVTALHFFDSVAGHKNHLPVYLAAMRFTLKANYCYFFTTDNHATAALIDSALACYNGMEWQNRYPRNYVSLLLFGGQIAYRLNQYSKANEYYFRAKKLGDAHLDPCERKPFYYSIGMVLYRQQNYAASLNYFEQAYNLQATCAQTTAVVLQQQEILDNIGLCYVQLKQDDSAMVHFNETIRVAERYRDSLGGQTMDKIYGVVYGNQAKVLMNKNRLAEAEQLSLKSIALNDREGYEQVFAQTIKLQLADIYHRKKQMPSMLAVLEGLSEKPLDAGQRLEWKRLMGIYYEQTGKPGAAMACMKDYFSLSDSIANAQRLLTAADVARQLRDKEQQLQIATLTKDNEVVLTSLLVTLAFSCMALLIIYLVYYNYRRNKKNLVLQTALNREIQNQKAAREEEARLQHKKITEAVIGAQEQERSAIGLELHDNINQVLTTIKLYNEMVLGGLAEPQVILPRSINHLQNCINEIRGLSRRLSAPTLGKISLGDSITDLVNSINEMNKVKITCSISGVNNAVLKKELHLGIYRILQEQLHNVLKHAQASEVSVQLEQREKLIRLQVTDNGKGFVVSKAVGGIGLVNMQTRAENLNGSFKLQSQPGRGCKIEVVFPAY